MRLPRNVVARARAEDGIFLVENKVSCQILAIVIMGLVAALDTAGQASGTSKERAIAADLAQGDLDTLRSMKYSALRTLLDSDKSPPPKDIEGVRYQLSRDSTPASQSEMAASCSNAVSRDVVRVTTTVTWNGMGDAKPVRMTTLIASPVGASGSVVVKLIRNDGTPLAGVSGSLSGQGGATTDGNGCARWDDVPPGDSYELFMQKDGFVQPDGTPTITETIDVSVEQTVTLQYEYDQAARVGPRFTYRWPVRSGNPWRYDADPKFVTIAHARLNGGQRVFTLGDPFKVEPVTAQEGTPRSVVFLVPNLYPFSTAYSGWPDQCASAKTASGDYAALSAPLPRGFFYEPADFKLPAIDLQVRTGANGKPTAAPTKKADGSPLAGPWVRLKSPCGTEWVYPVNQDVKATDATTNVTRRTIPMLGFPYGKPYKICAFDAGDPTRWDRQVNVNNTVNPISALVDLQYDKTNGSNTPQCGSDW